MDRILLIDNDSADARMLEDELHNGGYTLDRLSHENPAHVAKIDPDIILLDMPAVDGIDALQRLKSNPDTQSIPVMLLSATHNEELIIRALDMGAYDYIRKPVIYAILAARIRVALRLRENQRLLAEANRNLTKLASQDPLTGVYNRRHFLERADAEFTRARRYNRALAMIMLDVDEFKAVNDRYGHSMGDSALIDLTLICANNIRVADFVGRLGGEEFAICCPDADLAGAQRMAERIREALDQHQVHHRDATCSMTVSLGVTALDNSDRKLEEFLDRADRLLYRAKEQGRNRVISG